MDWKWKLIRSQSLNISYKQLASSCTYSNELSWQQNYFISYPIICNKCLKYVLLPTVNVATASLLNCILKGFFMKQETWRKCGNSWMRCKLQFLLRVLNISVFTFRIKRIAIAFLFCTAMQCLVTSSQKRFTSNREDKVWKVVYYSYR